MLKQEENLNPITKKKYVDIARKEKRQNWVLQFQNKKKIIANQKGKQPEKSGEINIIEHHNEELLVASTGDLDLNEE